MVGVYFTDCIDEFIKVVPSLLIGHLTFATAVDCCNTGLVHKVVCCHPNVIFVSFCNAHPKFLGFISACFTDFILTPKSSNLFRDVAGMVLTRL